MRHAHCQCNWRRPLPTCNDLGISSSTSCARVINLRKGCMVKRTINTTHDAPQTGQWRATHGRDTDHLSAKITTQNQNPERSTNTIRGRGGGHWAGGGDVPRAAAARTWDTWRKFRSSDSSSSSPAAVSSIAPRSTRLLGTAALWWTGVWWCPTLRRRGRRDSPAVCLSCGTGPTRQ